MAHLTLQQAVRDAILSARHDPLDVLLGFRDPLLSAGSHRLVQAGRLLVVAVFCGGVVAVGNGLLARQKRTGDKDEATAAGSGTGRTRPPTCRHQKSNLRPSGEVLGFFGESSRGTLLLKGRRAALCAFGHQGARRLRRTGATLTRRYLCSLDANRRTTEDADAAGTPFPRCSVGAVT
jgi:hypothetical protein